MTVDSGAGDASLKPSEQPMPVASVPGAFAKSTRVQSVRTTLALALLAAVPATALAERADRDKPTNVESDRMHYDEPRQTTIFTGRVVLTKGTLIIRGDELVLRQDAGNQQLATATGKPATFRQKRDGPGEQYIDGNGATIDYDSSTEKLVLTGAAVMSRSECGRTMDKVTGAQIVYDGQTETFTVDGKPSGQQAGAPAGRVRLTIQPRPDGKSDGRGDGKSDGKGDGKADARADARTDGKRSGQPAQPCPPGEPLQLQPDPGSPAPRPATPGPSRR